MIGRQDFFFVPDLPDFFRAYTLASSYLFVCFFNLFRSWCTHARVFGKTLVHEFPISYSRTEWYLFFSDSATTSAHYTAQCVFGAKN